MGLPSHSQESSLVLNGYVSEMPSVMHLGPTEQTLYDNLLHNRLKLYWYPVEGLTGSIQLRNRLIVGNQVTEFPEYIYMMGVDNGWVDMSFNLVENEPWVLNTAIDRLYLDYSTGKFNFTAGRQRINWSQTFVWNPNDIFNTYSFFEVDYPERPGSDALRAIYYHNYSSSAELTVKMDSAGSITAAGLFKFNKWNYDFQVLGGVLESSDYVAGIGWSGIIGNAAFRGEMSYFRPMENFTGTTGQLIISLGSDYMFDNSLYLQAEAIYYEKSVGLNTANLFSLTNAPGSVKDMWYFTYSFFLMGSYPVTPLVNASLAGMYFPEEKGFYIGPTVDINLSNNLQFSTIGQVFSLEMNPIPCRINYCMGFLRLKWSF